MTCKHGLDRDLITCLQCEDEEQMRNRAILIAAADLKRLRESHAELLLVVLAFIVWNDLDMSNAALENALNAARVAIDNAEKVKA